MSAPTPEKTNQSLLLMFPTSYSYRQNGGLQIHTSAAWTVAMKALSETGSCVAHTGLNFLVTKAHFELRILQPPPSKCCNFRPAP